MLNNILMCVPQIISFTYILCSLTDKKISFKSVVTYLYLIILLLLTLLTYLFFDNLLRPIMMFVSYTLIYKMMFKIKISESVINCFIGYIVTAIAEILLLLIYAFLSMLLDNSIEFITNSMVSSILSFIMTIIIVLLFKKTLIRLSKIILQKINNNYIWIVTICIASFLSINVSKNKINLTRLNIKIK